MLLVDGIRDLGGLKKISQVLLLEPWAIIKQSRKCLPHPFTFFLPKKEEHKTRVLSALVDVAQWI